MAIERIGRIKELAIYPVKSCGKLPVMMAKMTLRGMETIDGSVGDHEYVIADKNPGSDGVREFVHQRQTGMNVMTQILPTFEGEGLYLSWAGNDKIMVPTDLDEGEEVGVRIWNDVCVGVNQGTEISDWLSEHLGKPVILVKAGKNFERNASQSYGANDNILGTQDGYPVNWFPIESVDELSERAGQKIEADRFRAQIIGEGFSAQEEHAFMTLMIAGVLCNQLKPVTRCPIPNTNQTTGEKGIQPTKALTGFRMWKDKRGKISPIFGESLNPLSEGVVRVGDEIVLLERRDPPLVYGSMEEIKSK